MSDFVVGFEWTLHCIGIEVLYRIVTSQQAQDRALGEELLSKVSMPIEYPHKYNPVIQIPPTIN